MTITTRHNSDNDKMKDRAQKQRALRTQSTLKD